MTIDWTPVAGQAPMFKTSTNIVRVDVVVRDKDGKIIRGLKPSDFVVSEDGKPQAITSFDFQEITTEPAPPDTGATDTSTPVPQISIQAGLAKAKAVAVASAAKPPAASATATASVEPPASPEKLPGKRVLILFFDTSSMQPEEIDRAVKSANDYVDKTMTPADVVTVTAVGQTLQVLTKPDFTSDRTVLKNALAALDGTSGTGFEEPVTTDTSTDTTATTDTTDTDPSDIPLDDSEFGVFNNDRRLQAMQVLCDSVSYVETKKVMLYFSSGMSRSGSDNQIALRNATSACNRANVSVFPMDSRGLTALPPGGSSTQRSQGGQGAFSGRNVASQFSQLAASQETLSTIAQDTGGEVFLDTNDFGKVFDAAVNAVSAYYLIGYSSANPKLDGKFRKIEVKVNIPGANVEARKGYYADTDFAHLAKEGREQQLQDQISSPVAATDLPVVAGTAWFRVADNKFYVPLSVAVPGSALPPPGAKEKTQDIDVLGVMVDEQGRAVGRIRDTMQIPVGQDPDLAKKELQYQSGVELPAGHFMVKVAVRENTDGTLGAFQFPITIPDLKEDPLKISPVVFSTQLRTVRGGRRGGPGGGGPGGGGFGGRGGGGFGPLNSQRGGGGGMYGNNSDNPLISGGEEIVQSLTHVVAKDQQMLFYYEVYDPTLGQGGAPDLETSLAFYRGRVKVFETPVVRKVTVDDPARHAAVFQFAVPASQLKPGLYTCQVNVVDENSGKFAFPRLALYIKP